MPAGWAHNRICFANVSLAKKAEAWLETEKFSLPGILQAPRATNTATSSVTMGQRTDAHTYLNG